MKLRCTTNSIRIRIRRSELYTFLEQGMLNDQVNFPGGSRLQFALHRVSQPQLTAHFEQGNLRIAIPEPEVEHWSQPHIVGIEHHLVLEGDDQLHILIEKDFPCFHRPHEDKGDTFQDLASLKETPPDA